MSNFSFYALKGFKGEVILLLQALSAVFDLMLKLYFNVSILLL